jgi:hypothetical protein
MTEWIVLQQVPESMYAQLFFEQVSFLRSNALEVFNGTG